MLHRGVERLRIFAAVDTSWEISIKLQEVEEDVSYIRLNSRTEDQMQDS